MKKALLLAGFTIAAACGAAEQPAERDAAVMATTPAATTPATAAAAETARGEPAPWNGAPPNGADQKPAFAGQTRAPRADSNARWEVATVASGISKPWAVDMLADGRMIVTEKAGALRIVAADGTLSASLKGVPAVDARGQGGLLDVAVRGDTVCLSYSEPRGGGTNATAMGCGLLVGGATPRLDGFRVLFRQQPAWASTKHYGSRIAFAPDGNILVTTGERSDPEPRKYAQDLDSTIGKVVRITASGQSAPGNPYHQAGSTTPRSLIWSYGHRNLQSAALNPATGRLWTVEHGPKGGDELNIPEAGKNYGWPIITYGIDYSGRPIGEGITARSGMEQPVYYWDPVIGPSGMAFYTGDAFPAWKGSVFIGGLVTEGLVRLALDGDRVVGEERIDLDARIRDVIQAPDGSLLVLTDEDAGRLLRIRPRR